MSRAYHTAAGADADGQFMIDVTVEAWRHDRLAEARAVIADVAHHGDPLIRLACRVLVRHGETAEERAEAERLLVVLDARRPLRSAQREDSGRGGQ